MLLAIYALSVPQTSWARYEEGTSNYQAYLSGTNQITIKVPVFDKDGFDSWVRNGRLYYKVDGESKETMLFFWGVNDGEDDKDIDPAEYSSNRGDWDNYGGSYIYAHLKTESDGAVYCKVESDNRELQLTKNQVTRNKIYTHSGDSYWVNARWEVPENLRGKKLNFYWLVRRSGHGRYKGWVNGLDDFSITVPDSPPAMDISVSRPIITKEEVGKLMVPWIIGTKSVKKVQAVYFDVNNKEKTITYPDTTKVGMIPIYATEPHRSFYIKVDYLNAEGVLVKNRMSDPLTLPMIHAPKAFKATPVEDAMGSVLLSWEIDCINDEDLIEGDIFEIQRSITGNEEDYISLGMEVFESGKSEYTFKDSTLMASLTSNSLDRFGRYPNVLYRIRRGASSIWGWRDNPTKVSAMATLGNIHMLKPINAKSELIDKDLHTVKVTWDYMPNDKDHWYVWDERSTMLLKVMMRNRNKQIVDSAVYVLTKKEITEKTKTIVLSRPCINYDVQITTDVGNAPVNPQDVFHIKSVTDWSDLCKYTNEGGKTQGKIVSLETDLTIKGRPDGRNDNSLGSMAHPFMGVFEGNGHTFNPDKLPDNNNWVPFYYTEGAAIRNLNVNSNVPSALTAGGVIVYAQNTSIDNCVVHLQSSDAFTVVGMVYQGTDVTIQNSMVVVDQLPISTYLTMVGFIDTPRSCRIVNSVTSFMQGVLNKMIIDKVFPFFIDGSCTLENCYVYSKDLNITNDQGCNVYRNRPLSTSLLGDQWVPINEDPFVTPIMGSTTFPDNEQYFEYPVEGPSYYYEVSGKVEKDLETRTLQSSVVLNWELTGGEIDYCEVLRSESGKNKFEVIASNLIGTAYEDKKVSPLKKYDYTVRSAVSCEGTSYAYTDTVVGYCKNTGMVEGYVRFVDGTGIPGLTVNVTDPNGKLAGVTKTNDAGYYMVDNLSYRGQPEINYTVAVVSTGSLSFDRDLDQIGTTFNDSINHRKLKDFIVTSGYRFSGFVMYEGTSIPVPGVNFSVNGHFVHSASGKLLETDNNGKYSFYVLGDTLKTIIASKDNHIFTNDGKYEHMFVDKLPDTYFYDATKVKLIGRVAGGHIQGDLPLGNSLSQNNLGTDLTMVLTLEGDNTSSLVYDNVRPLLNERDTVFNNGHRSTKVHQTKVKTYRKRIVVTPDETTGEYTLELPPVKWKVQQVYGNGYGTLFQEGKVSDVVDLTDSLTLHTDTYEGSWQDIDGITVMNPTVNYNGIYNCIYHAPIELRYNQLNYDSFDFLGDKNYTAYNEGGNREVIPLAYPDSVKLTEYGVSKTIVETKYIFGHPVFSINRPYPFELSAQERYYWNNNQRSDTVDIVRLNGGVVTIHNGMESSLHQQKVDLNEEGIGYVDLTASQIAYNLTNEDALRTVTMTLQLDGASCEAEPFDAYILNLYAIPGASDILNAEKPTLVDILRDPPGAGSSATLSKGSTLKYSYGMDMKWSAGVTLNLSSGTGMNNYYGVTTSVPPGGFGPSYGIIQDSKTTAEYSNEFTFNGNGNRSFNYTMTATEDIKTSSAASMVGAPADLYIGVVQNNVVRPAVAIRAVSDSVFKQMVGKLAGGILPTGSKAKTGTMAEIASGKDLKGKVYHLVRNETMSLGAEIKSTFIHSQKNITDQIIPQLYEKCRSLMFIGTPEEAQKLANSTKKNVYLSLVEPTDSAFALMNIDGGEPIIYTLKDHNNSKTKKEGMSYVIVSPENYSDTSLAIDEVQKYCGIIFEWMKMIKRNEEEKLTATDLVRNFDVDGGSSTTYAENFESQFANSWSISAPMGINLDSYFGDANSTGVGESLLNLGNIFGKTFGAFTVKLLSKLMSNNTVEANGAKETDDGVRYTTEVNFTGSRVKFLIYPTMSYSVTPKNTKTQTYNRKESFSISMNNSSHLNFDVYRADLVDNVSKEDVMDVFSSQNLLDLEKYDKEFLDRHFDFDNLSNDFYRKPRGFVYRTRGGATAQPWENSRKTIFYRPGTELDARTLKIENPKIRLDKQSISGVPYGEPAVFKIYLTNDSEEPNAISTGLSYYRLFQVDQANPNGAKMYIDGTPLTGDGREIYVVPGQETEKTLEVYAGSDFDYTGLQICLISKSDLGVNDKVSFDVHYLHTAGPVNISIPGDKWVMNTDAPLNKKGYYLPVKIDGFDKKQNNFDHIEFQYKETARGDDYWTNLCSYYDNDSLMALASGTKAKIPENGYIDTEFYGEQIIMEKAYDLRAVLFIRNGSSFITSTSKVLSGIKDTRRPQIFGTPSPSDGILDYGENIIFDFSEAIEHNYIDRITDFEVKGEVNNDNIQESIALKFEGNSSVETEAERNFTDKDLTISMMVYPDHTNEEMPLFSHGKDNKHLQLWLTKDLKLRAVVNDVENKYISDYPIGSGSFQKVAMVIQRPDSVNKPWTMLLCNGGKVIGSFDMDEPYSGTGNLVFGRTNEANRHDSKFYSGRMMEAQIWYRALTPDLIANTYGGKRLSGYEMGLVEYYPMNEGQDYFIADQAQGAHAQAINTSWALPRSMSLKLDWDDRGMALKTDALNRTKEKDYTLMFWFKTNEKGRGALISNGAGYADDIGAENQFFIGFEGAQLLYRSNGMQINIPGDFSDNQWHHYAMTVNRARNVGNIYLDNNLSASFAVDSLGGIIDGYPLLGATLHKSKKDSLISDTHNWLDGYLDEICFFAQALPITMIKNYSKKSPYGDEIGLIAYMGFNRQERQSSNALEVVPYPYSQVIYKDENGNIIYEEDKLTHKPTTNPRCDYLFNDSITPAKVIAHIDQNEGAPIRPYEELKNINYSYVARDNQLLVNIDEPAEYVNKRNIYVTVRNIADLNGNAMESPYTMSCFVDNNVLRWEEKNIQSYLHYGDGGGIFIKIKNVSGSPHTYTVTNNPKWLTVSPKTDIIGPKEETWLELTVNKNLNVGTYDEILYLKDENGLAEPLMLEFVVYDYEPDWEVDKNLRKYSMNVVGRVLMGNLDKNQILTDSRDIVGVFDRLGVCHGKSNITYDEETGKSMLYLTVYNDTTSKDELYFKLWHYSTGKEMVLINYDDIVFVPSKIYGTNSEPCLFYADNQYVQTLNLERGWNWVSFNVYSSRFRNLNRVLDSFPWQNGDVMTDNTNNLTFVYSDNHWKLSEDLDSAQILPRNFYAVKVSKDVKVDISGYIIKNSVDRTMRIKNGWNSIGYTPMINLPVEVALADYFTYAQDGDVIKSHDEFAVFNAFNNGGRWEGNLEYMRPGEGYMLYHGADTRVTFKYPYYEPGSIYVDDNYKNPANKLRSTLPATMSLTAVADGLEIEPGDRLVAYADGEVCGEAIMSADSVFYMSIGGDRQKGISFAIEREGDIIAKTADLMTFKTNAVMGKRTSPTHIDFSHYSEMPQKGWYTLDGVKLQRRPVKKGVYINNGRKIVVE